MTLGQLDSLIRAERKSQRLAEQASKPKGTPGDMRDLASLVPR